MSTAAKPGACLMVASIFSPIQGGSATVYANLCRLSEPAGTMVALATRRNYTDGKEIAGWPRVAHVQLDSAWVKRFDAFLRIGKLVVTLIAGVFAAALVAATFNTIRLQIMANAAEIEVARFVGATDAFIRRPFRYFGALQGGCGGLLAAALVYAGGQLLTAPVSELAALYGGDFVLRGLSPANIGALAGVGAALGWLGAQLSVSLSLRRFD